MVLVAWATLIGPDAVFTGPGTIDRTFTPRVETCIPVPTPDADGTVETPDNPDRLPYCEEPTDSDGQVPDPTPQAPTPLWLKVLVWAFVFTGASLLVAAFVAVVRMALAQARPRRRVHRRCTRRPGHLATPDLGGVRSRRRAEQQQRSQRHPGRRVGPQPRPCRRARCEPGCRRHQHQ